MIDLKWDLVNYIKRGEYMTEFDPTQGFKHTDILTEGHKDV